MGMSSSQARLLSLTSRKNDIGYELTRLSNQKMSLTHDMQKISKDYNQALNAKCFKLSTNNGMDYVDLSYKNLMTPNSFNNNKPYLLTDENERVVIDERYRNLAKKISPDGNPTSLSEEKRLEILEDVTGISTNTLNTYKEYSKIALDKKDYLNELKAPVDEGIKTSSVEDFIRHLDWDYTGTDEINSAEEFETIINKIGTTCENYLPEDERESFKTMINNVKTFSGNMKGEDTKCNYLEYNSSSKNYTLNINAIYNIIFGSGDITWIDNQDKHNAYLDKKAEYDTELKTRKEDYETAISDKNQLLNSEQETMIRFYDSIFSSIAEKGWTYNSQVNDEDYLNQILQNNIYTLTSVTRNTEVDEDNNYVYKNKYNCNIASNCSNVIMINDNEARNDALVDYEYKKSLINNKETKIDLRMQDLQTEQSAINQMIQGIEKQIQENVERTMNIFS